MKVNNFKKIPKNIKIKKIKRNKKQNMMERENQMNKNIKKEKREKKGKSMNNKMIIMKDCLVKKNKRIIKISLIDKFYSKIE